jgi:hypothetical protein
MMGQRKRYEQFEILDNNTFRWKKERFGFDAIRHLMFGSIKTIQRQNFVKVGEPEEAHLFITLVDCREIHLYFDEQTIFFGSNTNKQQDIRNLEELYKHLLQLSYKYRRNHYLKELEEHGYFYYDECSFHPKEKTIIFRLNQEFPIATTNFIKSPYVIVLEEKRELTFWEKVKRELSLGKSPQFNIQTDPDVILALLEELFGLQWEY